MRIHHFKLLATLWGLPLLAGASGLDQLHAFLGETRAAKGSFSQTVVGKSGRKARQSSGSFLMQRPGKFRWSYDKPYVQLLVSDGERLWSFDPDLNQVVVKKVGQALGSSPAALLAGETLERNFDLKEGGTAGGLEFVEATPRAQDASFQKVRIGLRDKLPMTMEIQDNFGQTTTLHFSRFEPNPSFSSGLFRFTPPKGADVVGE
ncbi:outer membrane lipoprotein chaperone LolA [Denitratisoma oestradiolicum]|uniref:Outer-membrane lipoprotein carrier protein n=1 Tax=Denitratisoma oestradiolicum TaxID=311182 RepID=A0A6S6Y032_9PROT|nr:outer membrane lipoprotein chaperone LolA [Denitratisoma oestradiolicum]TWO80048.1 outer membrane lipoprotein carrier protein LolA [Denitratisoma oestradiolicum]CAB1369823.1 Outer-membrane lipoprotein carrier protein [Denitratisoma oestradiolicum]